MEQLGLLTTLAAALAIAFVGGLAARLMGLPALVGYLVAGIVISPFTPGYVADIETIRQLAELGVIFLMFGVGLHMNLADVLAVKTVAMPGAIARVATITAVSLLLGAAFGLDVREGLVLGLALSIGSTVVAIRTLEERGLIDSTAGRIAVGWLIIEDLATVLFLTLLPALAPDGEGNAVIDTSLALGKAAIFLAVMLTVGARVVPWGLELIARTGSRELFILATVGGALGIATGAGLFGVSVALGAFVAGVVISETETSHQAAADVLPFREAFAVLFFVSTGMLLDPEVILEHPGLFAATLAIVVVAKAVLTTLFVAMYPYSARTSLRVGVALAQIGEFSFIVAQQAIGNGVMSSTTFNVILAVAVVSITLNPLLFSLVSRVEALLRRSPAWQWLDHQGELPPIPVPAAAHVIIAGYGRVGRLSGHALAQLGMPYVVIDGDIWLVRELRERGVPAIWGDVANAEVLDMAKCSAAKVLLLAVPDESSALLATANARRLNPDIVVVVRAPDGSSADALRDLGASEVVVPEYEGGLELMRELLVALGSNADEASRFAEAMRGRQYAGELRLDEAIRGQGNPRARRLRRVDRSY
jgi:monovalent cation:H+ antiporter-2, CPA2 family